MSVLIKGMKMPESGYIDVRLHTYADGRQCATSSMGKHPYYKEMDVVEVPEPHGRLVDADFEEKHYASMTIKPTPDVTEQDKVHSLHIVKAFQMAKTVIEAEDE